MKENTKYSFFKRNGLSIVVLLLMFTSLAGQFFTGRCHKNDERLENGKPELSMIEYATSGHFIQATFENWESEFLQMALYVWLTISLFQVGSSESKKPGEKEEVDREPDPQRAKAPWPVRKGGIWVKIYSNSLTLAFAFLFLTSFALHFYGSLKSHNEEQIDKNLPPDKWAAYIGNSQFWFESFQNWQSEFLSVAAIVILSIWLRQKGSPESKPVDASYEDTGTS